METRTLCGLMLFASPSAAGMTAGAGEFQEGPATVVEDDEDLDHFEFTMGFIAGARLYLREWFFIVAAGEVGIVGQRFWGAELSLGFSFG